MKKYLTFAKHLKEKESKRELKPSGIEILLVLGHIGDNASTQRIANLAGYCRSSITRVLKRLNHLSLVSGSKKYSLTNKGSEIYHTVVIWRE